MQASRVSRPDGRYIWYYAFERPLPAVLALPQPTRTADPVELRWNHLADEHVIVSTGRQERTFLPAAADCPLCATSPSAASTTEIPSADYEMVAFENRFPSLRPAAVAGADESPLFRRAPAHGFCEVIVYSERHDATLATLQPEQSRWLVDVWAHRYADLAEQPGVEYVFIFENRGREIGVTLTHPHGQVYALPIVPPRPAREYERAAAHAESTGGRCLTCDLVREELASGARIVGTACGFAAYVPFAARLPYEVHIAATEHRRSLLDLTERERGGLAEMLRTLQAKYDNLWGFPMPYTMSMHQRATDGIERPGDHLHIEFAPPYRSADKLKYLAGIETGAGTFVNDVAPEATAAQLRASQPMT